LTKSLQPNLLVILGPTATGKSDLAFFLAQKFDGEVISADSRQVYRGMDLGTGKITKEEMQGIPHHLLDSVNPCEQFSVAQYQELATQVIAEVHSRSHLPILCGGTGQYIKAVTRGSELPPVPPNEALRAELETWETADLAAELERLDPDRHQIIDRDNRRRLVRAIEIVKALGKVPELRESARYRTLTIGLMLDAETLRDRIHVRLVGRLNQGMLQEVEELHTGLTHGVSKLAGLSWERLEAFGLEYKYCAQHLQGRLTEAQMIQKLETEIWRYAKRQMTWFKKFNTDTHWYHPEQREAITELVSQWLQH